MIYGVAIDELNKQTPMEVDQDKVEQDKVEIKVNMEVRCLLQASDSFQSYMAVVRRSGVGKSCRIC